VGQSSAAPSANWFASVSFVRIWSSVYWVATTRLESPHLNWFWKWVWPFRGILIVWNLFPVFGSLQKWLIPFT
jgi:hypothetical protein